MITGRALARRIDQAVAAVEHQLVEAYRQLDAVHHTRMLHWIETNGMKLRGPENLEQVQQQLEWRATLVERQRSVLADCLRAEVVADGECEAVTRYRERAAAAVRNFQARQDALLANDPRYLQLQRQATQARSIADATARKARQAAQAGDAPLAPYHADQVFTYLRSRGYGTPAYRRATAHPIRVIDGLLARRYGFQEALRNYEALKARPTQLDAHAQAMAAQARATEERAIGYRRRVFGQAGLGPLLAGLRRTERLVADKEQALLDAREQSRDARLALFKMAGWKDDASRAMRARMGAIDRAGSHGLPDSHQVAACERAVAQATRRAATLVAFRRRVRAAGFASLDYRIGAGGVDELLSALASGADVATSLWDAIVRTAVFDPPYFPHARRVPAGGARAPA